MSKLKTAALSYEIAISGDAVSNEVHLLPNGNFNANDGRPYECESWFINPDTAKQVIARFKSRAKPILIDYDHLSLNDDRENPVFAAGWINELEFRDGGLFGINVDWTSVAKQQILDKQMRYISPVFVYIESTGEVLDVVSVALTNTPALDNLEEVSITALTRILNQEGFMADDKHAEKIAALTAERDAEKTKVAALTQENEGLKTQVTALTQEKAALTSRVATLEQEKVEAAAANEKQQCADLLQAALTSGKILPSMNAYLEKKTNVAELREAIDAFAGTGVAQALLTKQHKPENDGGNHGLSDAELAICTKMGVTPEQYLKSKAGE